MKEGRLQMKISIIIPIYNEEKYLESCIKSILNQTYTDFECILVDDGSSDNSSKICDEYALQDTRIVVIHSEHKGVSSARSIGLKMAKGDYISFVDSDDMISNNMLESMMNHIISNNADIVVCGYEYIFEETRKSILYAKSINIEIKSGKEVLKTFGEEYSELHFVLCNKLYRKELFEGIEFPYGMLHEDEFVLYKIYYSAQKVVIINDCFYKYYKRPGSITNVYSLKRLESYIEYNKQRINYFKDKNKQIYNAMLKVFFITVFQNYKMCLDAKLNKKNIRSLFCIARSNYKNFFFIKDISFQSRIHILLRVLCMLFYIPVSDEKCY